MEITWRLATLGIFLCTLPHLGDRLAADLNWSELNLNMEKMHRAMASVGPSGHSDVDFVSLMLPHHQGAIDMAKAQLLHGTDPQMRRLAQEITTDQQSEIALMQLWLRQHSPSSLKESQAPSLGMGKEIR